MKKLLTTFTLIGSLTFSASALAKSGHSLGIEASRLDVSQEFGSADYLGSDDKIMPTLRYGYKFQLDKFFITPSASYTFGNVEIKDTDGTDDKSTLSQIFTLEGDFGYNVTEKFGIFGTAGLIRANFEREVSNTKSDANSVGAILGFGVQYDILDNLSVNAKYQRAAINFDVENNTNDYEVDADIIKVGVSYNF